MARSEPGDVASAVSMVLQTLTKTPDEAAATVFGFANREDDVQLFLAAARRLTWMKLTGAHDVKFPVAIFEDASLVSEAWRPHLLAASVFWLQGTDRPDAPAMIAARHALYSS